MADPRLKPGEIVAPPINKEVTPMTISDIILVVSGPVNPEQATDIKAQAVAMGAKGVIFVPAGVTVASIAYVK
jgi:hypothetical protein